MDNELLHILRNISTLTQLMAAIIGSFYFYKYRNSILKYFLFYLWVTCIIELSGYLLLKYQMINNNSLIYNIYSVYSFLYLFYLYLIALKDKNKRVILKIASVLYIFVLIFAGFFEDYLREPQTISYVFAETIVILAVAFYFTEVLKSEKALYANKSLFFWISLGLLLFSTGTIPFTLTIKYYINEVRGFHNAFAINYILIIVQNICFIIGFILSDRKQVY